uniref:MIR domain-containing protein n=1 Tax=Rhizophagus irregularis (strain DAOM 181602 / DAOM 197198 / MUCL 43194) TaxID=747089 RepID=U9UGP8_RHIID
MDLPRYEGNIHPDEWICNIQKFDYYWRAKYGLGYLDIAISLVDATIKLPDDIFTGEELRNALKEDISFTIFKNTNKRKLQSLKYNLERNGGDTSKFVSTFLSCNGNDKDWIFRHSKFENYDGSLKSNDTINLSIKKTKWCIELIHGGS